MYGLVAHVDNRMRAIENEDVRGEPVKHQSRAINDAVAIVFKDYLAVM